MQAWCWVLQIYFILKSIELLVYILFSQKRSTFCGFSAHIVINKFMLIIKRIVISNHKYSKGQHEQIPWRFLHLIHCRKVEPEIFHVSSGCFKHIHPCNSVIEIDFEVVGLFPFWSFSMMEIDFEKVALSWVSVVQSWPGVCVICVFIHLFCLYKI